MKKLIYVLLIGIFTLSFTNNIQATSFAGAEISYVNLGGSLYQVTLTFYRDCSAISAPTTINVNFACSSNPVYNFTATLNQYGTAEEITNACPQFSTSCSGGNNGAYGIQKYTYQANVTLPPCDSWTMYYYSGSRNPSTTITGTANWYIPAELNNLVVFNSSPTFNSPMIPIAKLNQLNRLDYGCGLDPDGDSLAYSLYAPYSIGPTPLGTVVYNSPYSATNFLPSSTPIILNPTTGILSFTPTQVLNTIIGIKVEQWRNINGVMTIVGANYRDLMLIVKTANSSSPVLSGIDTTLSHTYSPNDTIYEINKCFIGNPIVFSINGYDADVYNPAYTGSAEVFNISWNAGISDASFTPHYNATDSAYAEFYWLPSMDNFSAKNFFTATIKDSSCDNNLSNSYNYSINITDNYVSIGNDTTICFGEVLSVNAISNNSYDNYTWSIDGTAYTSSSVDSVVLRPSLLSPGVHTLKLETQGGNNSSLCNNTQEINITVIDIHTSGAFSDTSYCSNLPFTFDAGVGTTYVWQNNLGYAIGMDKYFTPTESGVYRLIVQNQSCISYDTFEVNIITSPPSFSFGNDTTIANNASITLSMPSGYSDYLWSNGSTNNTLVIDNSFNWINTIIGTITENVICTSTDTIMVYIGNVGIVGAQQANIKVFPNPIYDVLNINIPMLNSKASLELYNINGKLLLSAEFFTKEYILKNLDKLAPGNYFLKLFVNGDEEDYSIIKK